MAPRRRRRACAVAPPRRRRRRAALQLVLLVILARVTMRLANSMRSAGVRRAGRRLAAVAIALVVLLGVAAEASGHGARLPFDQWGGFSAGAARCQRVIARAAAQCAASAWTARRACRSAELAGGACDETATDAAIEAARIRALNTIDEYCSERQAIDLQYLGSFDLQADVITFCRGWETAADSAVYGPLEGSSVPGPTQRGCIQAAADAADGVMQFSFRNRRQCMDRIASISLQAPNRTALLDGAAQRIGAAYAALTTRLSARCGADSFAALYGRPPATFVEGLGARADCLGAAFYIQDAVLFPAPVFGNAIVEPGEDCDDGNSSDGDACPATCVS